MALLNDVALLRHGIIVACSAVAFGELVGELSLCLGPSMQPTLAPRGDLVLVDKLSPRWRPLKAGEIVTCNSPTKPSGVVCKRITAVGGERVHVLGRRGPVDVPAGHIWLEGDNHRNSTDSRSYGAVPLALVRGRVVGRVWPPHKWGGLPSLARDENDSRGEPGSRKEAEARLWAPVPSTPAPIPVRSDAQDNDDSRA